MSSSMRIASSFYVPSFALFLLLLPIVLAVEADPLYHFCTGNENFTANSPYESNLNKLLADLTIKAPPTGFGLGSVGYNSTEVNGLALCRGDVSDKDCNACIVEAGSQIRKQCPYNKGAVVWYDSCLVKYSDNKFFGKIDTRNRFYMWNVREVDNPQLFNQRTKELLSRLSEEAFGTTKLYATGELKMEESKKLYGLVQCTRDLSNDDCKTCLDSAINELPSCCDGKEGGRVVGGSCNFRYEIYPIVSSQA